MGLSSHLTEQEEKVLSEQRNIHHIPGSIFDPNNHALMLELLDGNSIDVLSARPKGAYKLFPMSAEPTSYLYYYRMINFLYQHMSPNGFMFFETPSFDSVESQDAVKWQTFVLDPWSARLNSHGIDTDYNGSAMVIRRHPQIDSLPQMDLYEELHGYGADSPDMKTWAFGVKSPKITQKEQVTLLQRKY